MSSSLRRWRTRAPWLLVPLFVWLARPTVPLLLAGLALAVAGAVIRAWAAGTLHKNRVLTTDGPYAHTRNPLYLGSLLIGLGVALASGRLLLVAACVLFFAALYPRTVRSEERHLAGLYGDDFAAYRGAVPPFLPRLRPWRPRESGSAAFSLRQYRRNREWEAALGVVAAFAVLAVKLVW